MVAVCQDIPSHRIVCTRNPCLCLRLVRSPCLWRRWSSRPSLPILVSSAAEHHEYPALGDALCPSSRRFSCRMGADIMASCSKDDFLVSHWSCRPRTGQQVCRIHPPRTPRITASSQCALLGYTTTCKNFIVTLTNHALFRMACCLFLHPERPTRQNLGLPRWSPTHGGTQVSAHFTWRLPVALSRLGPILPASMHGDMSILCHLSHLHLSMRMCALFVSIVCAVFHRVAPRCTGVWCAG